MVLHDMNRSSGTRTQVLPLRERLKEETQRAILEAAEQVFGASGLSGARMDDIAARAGVSVGTLYNHFEDRDALLSTLIVSRREDLLRRLDDVLAAHDREPFEPQLEHFLRSVLEHFDSHKAFLAILLESEHARMQQPMGLRSTGPNTALVQLHRRVEELLVRGRIVQALRPEGAELFSSFLVGILKATLSRELYAPSGVPLANRAPALVLFFLHGAGA
jgi:AcrR family transcriptional regulator